MVIWTAIAALTATFALSFFVPVSNDFGDALIYKAMSVHPSIFTHGRWGFRILTPWIVHLLPLSITSGFFVTTVIGLAGTATVLALFCLQFGLSIKSIIAAPLLFLFSFAATTDLSNYCLVDPLAYFGTMLMFLFLAQHRPNFAAISILLTVLDKEWGLFLIVPFGLWLALEAKKTRRIPFVPISLGVILPVVAFWTIRHWPGFGDNEYQDSLSVVIQIIRHGYLGNPILGACGALGALVWIAPFGFSRAPAIFRLTALLIPFVLLQWIDSGTKIFDQMRMMAYVFLPVILLTVCALDRLSAVSWSIAMLACSASLASPLFPPLVSGAEIVTNMEVGMHDPIGARFIIDLYSLYRRNGFENIAPWTWGTPHVYLTLWAALGVIFLLYAPRLSQARVLNSIRSNEQIIETKK